MPSERFDQVIYLISITTANNNMGDAVETTTRRETFAKKNSVRRSEFYQGEATGLRPQLVFTIWTMEYNGESQLEYSGQTYNIIRTYEPDDQKMELVCSGLVTQ